jgi:phage terminase large subunit
MERDKARDYEKYRHIWLGEILTNSDAQVFKTPQHWVVERFEDDPKAFKYFGLDFGFSQDPTAGVRCYIKDNKLYITHEAVKLGLEIDDTGKFLEDRLPDLKKYTIYADNARPESISFICRQGYRIEAVKR